MQKTLHILEYVDDPAFRRRVLIGLNNGEHLHSLARDINFGRQERFHDRGYEAQLNRASALSVVINAIAVWNTRYFEQAHAELTRQGVAVPAEVWRHVSPLQWAHIHLNGSYHFTGIELEGEFRPLRDFQGSMQTPFATAAEPLNSSSVPETTLVQLSFARDAFDEEV